MCPSSKAWLIAKVMLLWELSPITLYAFLLAAASLLPFHFYLAQIALKLPVDHETGVPLSYLLTPICIVIIHQHLHQKSQRCSYYKS